MKKLMVSSYISALIALAIAFYTIFQSNQPDLQKQGIEWFAIAILCFILPASGPIADKISNLSFKDFKVEFKELKEKLEKLEIGSKGVAKVHEYLYYDIAIGANELKTLLSKAPESALTSIYGTASEFREKMVYQILRAEDNPNEQETYRARIEKLIPIFEALIQAENKDDEKLHNYYAQLAYVLKDKPKPDWHNAYKNIDQAINLRNKLTLGNIRVLMYEFNRLACNTSLPPAMQNLDQMMRDFAVVYADTGSRFMLFETDPVLAPHLLEWVANNKSAEYELWKSEKGRKQIK